MKKIILIFLICAVFFHSAPAQSTADAVIDKVTVPSANAASFKVFGDIPVSMYTGVPQIEVPVHTIKTGYGDIPIVLRYHAAGFKPEQHPSWVGLGWNLNAGGVINREVKGIKDENEHLGSISSCRGLGFLHSFSAMNNDNWFQYKNIDGMVPGFSYTYLLLDRAPDVFSFNFLGYSGKFFLNHLGEWKVQCDAPIKVELNQADIKVESGLSSGAFPNITKFTLTDEKGVKYIFGGNNAVEYSTSMTPENYNYRESWTSSSWYLTEIIPPVGNHVYFTYERGPYQSSFSYTAIPTLVERRSGSGGNDLEKAHSYIYNGWIGKNGTEDLYGSVLSGSIISPVYLTGISSPEENLEISFVTSKSNDLSYYETTYTDRFYQHPTLPSGLVDAAYLSFDPTLHIPYFDRNPGDKQNAQSMSTFKNRFLWLKLDEIRFTYVSNQIKKFKFYYREQADSRLRLDSVSTIYTGAQQNETYSFEYHPHLSYPNNKEYEYLSEYSDHWGFSNLKFLWNKNLAGIKSPIRESAKFGILSKVTYPTKGNTQFFYENHDYSQSIIYNSISPHLERANSDYELSGGLRIKRVVSVDGNGNSVSKEYVYEKPEGNGVVSSGILQSFPMYLIGNGATSSHLFSDGLHLTYQQVIEKLDDGSFSATTFKTEDYTVSIGESLSGCPDDRPVAGQFWGGYLPHSSRSIERGKVLDEYFCNSEGKIIKSKHHRYVNIGRDASNFIRCAEYYFDRRYYIPGLTNTQAVSSGDIDVFYYYYTYSNKLQSTKEVTYQENIPYPYNGPLTNKNVLISEQYYEYDSYGQMIKESISTSQGATQETRIKYPYTDNPSTGILYDMTTKNMLGYPVEKKSYLGTSLVGGNRFDYNYFGSNNIQLASITDVFRDNSTRVRCNYTKYLNEKLVERSIYNGLTESYLYDVSGKHLRAIVKNAGISQIKNKIGGYTIDEGRLGNNPESEIQQLRSQLTDAMVTSFDYYEDGNLKKMTNEAGVNTTFDFNETRQLKSIKDHYSSVIEGYEYKYANGITPDGYLNDYLEIQKTKNCPQGQVSDSPIKYEVPEGIYLSKISKADADNKAREKYDPKAQEMADKVCKCIRYGIYSINNGDRTTVNSSNVYYQENDVFVNYIHFTWSSSINTYSDYDWYTAGVKIAQLGGSYYPQNITYKEFRYENTTWIIWIDSSGAVKARLKTYSIDAKPQAGSNFYIENLIFPLN